MYELISIASIINATEALNFDPESPNLHNWHDSLYYIMVTFSTIGFGDLTPSSTYSRVVVMFLIILVIIYVPWQTGKIIEIFNSLNKFQRASYSIKSDSSHVILSGQVSFSAVVDFCREFFMADELGSVVILNNSAPDINIRRLLNHPFYRNRLYYIQGDMMSIPDLKRVQATFATGMFFISETLESVGDEEQENVEANERDTQVLFRTLFAKTCFPGLPIFAQVNDFRSEELASHCGVDRLLCIDQIKASLFASNCVCPGIQTLILNMIHTYKDVDPGIMREFWTQEYQCGLVNQIHSFKIPSGLVGMSFVEVAKEIYNAYNTMVFALVSVNSGFNQNKIRFNIESSYKLKFDDIAICIGDGGDEIAIRIALHFKEKQAEMVQKGLDIELQQFISSGEGPSNSPLVVLSPFNPDAEYNAEPTSQFSDISLGSVPNDLKNHIIVTGYVSARILHQFVKCIRERKISSRANSHSFSANSETPIVFILESLPEVDRVESVWSEIMSYSSIFVIKGRGVQKSILEKASINNCNRIVIFSKQGTKDSSSDAQSVFLIKLIQKVLTCPA